MTDAVTAGCFSDFKLVKTRNVAQLVIELPLERADEALELLGGLPRPSREVWVAVARLTGNPFTEAAKPATAPVTPAAPAAEPERRQTTNANRAGMMIGDPLFWQWVNETYMRQIAGAPVRSREEADEVLKRMCMVDKKRDLDVDLDAAARFDRIRRDYYAWTQEPVA